MILRAGWLAGWLAALLAWAGATGWERSVMGGQRMGGDSSAGTVFARQGGLVQSQQGRPVLSCESTTRSDIHSRLATLGPVQIAECRLRNGVLSVYLGTDGRRDRAEHGKASADTITLDSGSDRDAPEWERVG
ncbi:hypothetical protein FHL15_004605 [Xylaria flabelliformis]|uniref:Cyanovirin-N domain-containing protein n=1 Tax=Xylaria flabelliformis TaxID=2512241 RepID=A0A553I2L4_9PEZI|nr:hypothetical protein FHL15_004605 [Xylaria flabelliformis]